MIDGRKLRARVVAEDPSVKGGLSQLLSAAGVDVTSAAVDGVVWDMGLGQGPAPRGPSPLLALAPDDERAREALRAGAKAVLRRDAEAERIKGALLAISLGGMRVVDAAFEALLPRNDAAERPYLVEPLTAREREVLSLMAAGLSNPAIGRRLKTSAHTAKFHVNAILDKLGARGRTDAVVRAARLGLIEL